MNTISYRQDILDLFKKTFDKDESFIDDWIVSWEYQEKRKKRKVNYGEGLPEEFYTYDNPSDIHQWVNWMLNVEKSNFLDNEQFRAWTDHCYKYDQKIFKNTNYETSEEIYRKGLGLYNAQDYFFANLIPYPGDNDSLKVLDFGAGFGRQSNLWTGYNKNTIYVGMDAIPKSYCLQHYYYASGGNLRQDYIVDPESFTLENAESGIHHLPTWRWDLLPDGYFDKIILVQVLQEMNSKLARKMIKTFHRVLKPGGSLYIRDNDSQFRPAHRLDTNKLISDSGFTLEYRGHLQHKRDLHGIPRIWRKTDPEVLKSQEITMKQRANELMLDIDALTKGKLKKLVKGN